MADVTSPFGFPYPEDTDLVRDGAQDIENLATGVNDYLTGGYLYAGTIYYTSSGTFVKADPFGQGDIGLRAIRVRLVGGGGGGGGTGATIGGESAQGGGGGAGGYAESFITDIAGLDSSVTVTRGGGGAGGGAGANNGLQGGASSFGTLVAASGGFGGFGAAGTSSFPAFTQTQTGGGGSAGQIQARGGSSTGGVLTSGSPGGAFVVVSSAGSSVFSGGPSSGINADGVAGLLGAGGSGPWVLAGSAARPGGTGGNGIVIVDCFV